MFGLFDSIAEWFRGILIEGIIANFTGMFNEVNTKVGEIAAQVGSTPEGWNSGVFGLVRTLSETVIIPIAGIILTFVLCYELISMVIDKMLLSRRNAPFLANRNVPLFRGIK